MYMPITEVAYACSSEEDNQVVYQEKMPILHFIWPFINISETIYEPQSKKLIQ